MTATKKPTPEPVADVTIDEITDSITGYDEIAIEDQLKLTFAELAQARNHFKWYRAHIAIYLVRKGTKAGVAWKTAMSMPQVELQTYFPKSLADPTDLIDESTEGKGDGTPAPSSTKKPPSASSPE